MLIRCWWNCVIIQKRHSNKGGTKGGNDDDDLDGNTITGFLIYMVAIVQLVFVDLAMEQCSFRPNLHKVMALEPGCEEALSVTLFSSY